MIAEISFVIGPDGNIQPKELKNDKGIWFEEYGKVSDDLFDSLRYMSYDFADKEARTSFFVVSDAGFQYEIDGQLNIRHTGGFLVKPDNIITNQ